MPTPQTNVQPALWRLESGSLSFSFHPSGDLYEALGGGMMLNQLLSSPLDGSLNNLFLRIRRPGGFSIHPLLGVSSASAVSRQGQRITWSGTAEEVAYEVSFLMSSSDSWFWEIKLDSAGVSLQTDVIYGQDIGLAAPAAVRSNEAYCSQYIDHSAYRDERYGWRVCSRQNQPQGGLFPYVQQGCLTGAESYSTDGFQFFGLSFKDSHRPEALSLERLPSEVYQYEFAYTALQSKTLDPANGAEAVFYGLFREHHPEAVTEAAYSDRLEEAWREASRLPAADGPAVPVPLRSADLGDPLPSRPLAPAELAQRYPVRLEEEYSRGELLSFFTPDYEHVVLKAKELSMERPHGHILMSGAPDRAAAEMLTSTAYMYGVFHSQLVVGNTSFNKLIGHARSALNAAHASGLRLYAEVDGQYRLLAMPSLFEIGFNYARWLYVLDDDTLEITSFTSSSAPDAVLEIKSASHLPRRYLVTAQITMSDRDYELPYALRQQDGSLIVSASEGSPIREAYPELSYRINAQGTEMVLKDERRLMPGLAPSAAPLLVLETSPSAAWSLRIGGRLDGWRGSEPDPAEPMVFESEKNGYRAGMAKLMNHFRLEHPQDVASVRRLDMLAWWYTHNMRVHFAVPHGLEQYGGAAWGTRDVCQGPAEYFLAVQHYEAVKDIIRTVYAHQYEASGGWPQWFMFDRYYRVQQEESHGDIIVWPLKLLGDYMAATGDLSILDTELPYTDEDTFEPTRQKHSLYDHVLKQMDYIRSRFLHGTSLSSYGDGDWDDTLQPASAELRAYMVSSWTVALTYQAVRQLGGLLAAADGGARSSQHAAFGAELLKLAGGIREDFHRYMNPDEVIPGFLYMEDARHPDKWLHPTDERTGIQYRLLPMTRSMIAGLITPEQAEAHYALIKRELSFPDGVRLMNRPAAYEGGVSTRFKRAEQAANFGREIGLQYVHAHIRFIEAMAKLGKPDEAWQALQVVNPIGIAHSVPNAELRQSNAYFSSSDGRFATRYEAAARFEELRQGTAAVKGGWRIYSSGPGIYMNQLISNVLGIRVAADVLQLDPVLPAELDGMSFRFAVAGRSVRILYSLSRSGGEIRRVAVNGEEAPFGRIAGSYRSTGAELPLTELERLWLSDAEAVNEIVIEA